MTKVGLNTSKELLQSSLLSPPPTQPHCGLLSVGVSAFEKMTKLWVCKGNTAGRLWFQPEAGFPKNITSSCNSKVSSAGKRPEVRFLLETILINKLSPLSVPPLIQPFHCLLPTPYCLHSASPHPVAPHPHPSNTKTCRIDWMASVYSSVLYFTALIGEAPRP